MITVSAKINLEKVTEEHEALIKTRNMMQNHYGISDDSWTELHSNAMEGTVDVYKNSDSVAEGIQNVKRINRDRTDYTFGNSWRKEHLKNKISSMHINNPTFSYLASIASRMAALEYLRDTLSKINEWDVKCSEAAVKADREFRYKVKTSVGWQTEIKFTHEIPVGTMDMLLNNPDNYNRNTIYFGVDGHWLTDVDANHIAVVDIAGKSCLTLCATEIAEHELIDDDVKLYQAKVCYTKVPRDVSSWRMGANEINKVFHLEDKVIAVQSLPATKPIITTGKDKSWAVRTMRGRMKKKMFDLMDI